MPAEAEVAPIMVEQVEQVAQVEADLVAQLEQVILPQSILDPVAVAVLVLQIQVLLPMLVVVAQAEFVLFDT